MIRSRKTSPPAACGPTHHCMVNVYTLWLLLPVHSTHRLGMGTTFHTQTGKGTLNPHADWERDLHPYIDWEWDPKFTHRLGMGPSFHTQTGKRTLIPWEWDPHSTHRLGKQNSHIISKVHTVEVHNAARDVDSDKQSWSQFSCIVKPKF